MVAGAMCLRSFNDATHIKHKKTDPVVLGYIAKEIWLHASLCCIFRGCVWATAVLLQRKVACRLWLAQYEVALVVHAKGGVLGGVCV